MTVLDSSVVLPEYQLVSGSFDAAGGSYSLANTNATGSKTISVSDGRGINAKTIKDKFSVVSGNFTPAPGHLQDTEVACSMIVASHKSFDILRSKLTITDCGTYFTEQPNTRVIEVERSAKDTGFSPAYPNTAFPDETRPQVKSKLICGHGVGRLGIVNSTNAVNTKSPIWIFVGRWVFILSNGDQRSCPQRTPFVNSNPEYEYVTSENTEDTRPQKTVFTAYETY